MLSFILIPAFKMDRKDKIKAIITVLALDLTIIAFNWPV